MRAGLSQNALAKVVGINASYINRLESGEREAPTREVAVAIAKALDLAPEELDRLLFSGGHVPPSLQKLGPADSTIAAVTRLLTNDRLSPEARADFRAIIETIAIRWQCNVATALTPKPLANGAAGRELAAARAELADLRAAIAVAAKVANGETVTGPPLRAVGGAL